MYRESELPHTYHTEKLMQSRRRKKSHLGVSLPFQSAAKGMSTAQGRYTLYALLICAIIGMVLSQMLPAFMPIGIARKLAFGAYPNLPEEDVREYIAGISMLIAFGVSAIILIVCLLKMKSITNRFEKRRLEAFNERLGARKQSEDRDG